MLSALSIRNIVLIEKLDLSFTPGLNVFTGETGAGKSIVLDSLALALGARGDAGLVRTGCKEGTVTAQFDIVYGHPIQNILSAHGIDSRDGVVLRRVQNADGRTRATINDTPVTAALLRQTSAALVEIHGQHDDRALVEPSSHRELLDVYAGVLEDKRVVAAKWTDWRTLQEQAREAEEALAQARRDADYTRAACEELSALAPLPGEEEALAVRRQQILAAQKVRAGLDEALQQLTGTNFPSAGLSSALRRLERQCAPASPPESIKQIMASLERVLVEAGEARTLLETQLRDMPEDQDLDALEERLFKLRAAARKYRVAVPDLAQLRGRMNAELQDLDGGEQRLASLVKKAGLAAMEYSQAAETLSTKRVLAAKRLDKAVMKQLKPLRLDKARFLTHTERLKLDGHGICGGPAGLDTVMFLVAANEGAVPGPMMKVASGGELARFILALKAVAAQQGGSPVMVFDEIDTGVGGATAAAIGERLYRLGQRSQVIAVTHSAQVAAYADQHYRLHKTNRGNGSSVLVQTLAERLDNHGRREEIARMLAGAVITDEARAAAVKLMGAKP